MYIIQKDQLIAEDKRKYNTYGVADTVTGKVIHDISLNAAKMETFIRMLNEGNLDLIHLEDVIEDFIDELI